MTDNRPDSPTFPVRPRVMPRPAADDNVDPIDVRPATPAAVAAPPVAAPDAAPATVPVEPVAAPAPAVIDVAPPAVELTPEPPTENEAPAAPAAPASAPDIAVKRPRVRRQEVFVQVGSRVTVETRDILDDIIEREGISMRVALENAIRAYGERDR